MTSGMQILDSLQADLNYPLPCLGNSTSPTRHQYSLHNNCNIKNRLSSEGGVHSSNYNNSRAALEQYLNSNSCQPVTLQYTGGNKFEETFVNPLDNLIDNSQIQNNVFEIDIENIPNENIPRSIVEEEVNKLYDAHLYHGRNVQRHLLEISPILEDTNIVDFIIERSPNSVSVPGTISSQCLPTSSVTYQQQPTQQCATAVESVMDLDIDSERGLTGHGFESHQAYSQNMFIPEYDLSYHPAPCHAMGTARDGTNILSQSTSDPIPAPEPITHNYPNTTFCQQQEPQYTLTAKRNIEFSLVQEHPYISQDSQAHHNHCLEFGKMNTDLHQTHPGVCQSGQVCGPSLLINPDHQENLTSFSAAEYNGPSSSIKNTLKKNISQKDDSNENASNHFPRRIEREYTEKELVKKKKNNESSKRSRQKRRMEEKERELERKDLEKKNMALKQKLITLRKECSKGHVQLLAIISQMNSTKTPRAQPS